MSQGAEESAADCPGWSRNERVAIIGLGLMGGSLGLALKRTAAAGTVYGYARRKETRELAASLGAVDRTFDKPEEAVEGADIVVFCTPVLSIPELAATCAPHFGPDSIITDVGSTKAELLARMETVPGTFIGSHPIAGSEQTGLNAAGAGLYQGCVVVITPAPGTGQGPIARLAGFWKAVGGRTVIMPAEQHDRLIARTSHLPHLLAAMLVEHVAANNPGEVKDLCGNGFRDTTRIAEGSPALWHDVVASNCDAILRELDGFCRVVGQVRAMLEKKDFAQIRRFLEKSREKRRNLAD